MRNNSIIVTAMLVGMLTGTSTEAAAELGWLRLTLSGMAGYATFDESFQVDDGIPIEARGGISIFRHVGIEGTYGKVLADYIPDPNRDFPVDHWGADLVFNILPTSVINPYVLGGWAQLDLDPAAPDGDKLKLNGWEYGGGVKIALARLNGARIDLRLDARNVAVKNDLPLAQAGETTNHFFATGGIHMEFFGEDKDSDRDGVPDHRDSCPNTPYGATVDNKGCTMDTDGDGVPDGIDLCPATPAGAVVDSRGCPLDTDGDGVLNGIDQCEGTPDGAVVDETGCPLDQDGDGVPDGLDACADTPAGVAVNNIGCPEDSDGDGVLDGYDRCEGTPKGVKVDEYGCPIPETKLETDLAQAGLIRLSNVYFDTNTAKLKPESHVVLDEVGQILLRWPSLKIEIGGHADSSGPDDYNLDLSRRRAHAVLEYLMDKHPGLRFDQFFVKGYGETQPIESNATANGRAVNRRVEFKVLNRETLPEK